MPKTTLHTLTFNHYIYVVFQLQYLNTSFLQKDTPLAARLSRVRICLVSMLEMFSFYIKSHMAQNRDISYYDKLLIAKFLKRF